MKLCDVKGKGPTEKAVLIFRLEDVKLKANEKILSHSIWQHYENKQKNPVAGTIRAHSSC